MINSVYQSSAFLAKKQERGSLGPMYSIVLSMKILLPALCTGALLLVSCGPATPMAPGTGSGSTGTSLGAQASYTATEVAQHNTEKDCWASVDSNVYDLTDWVNRHPGGSEAIISACGKDLTNWEHPGGVPMAIQVKRMARYKLGTLAQ